jgi:hypothetical protein
VIGIFKNNNPFALLLLALLALLPGITGDPMVHAALPAGSTTVFKTLSSYLSFLEGAKGMLGKIFCTALLLAEALLFNKIVTDHKLTEKAGFLPALSFLLLNMLLPFPSSPVFLLMNGLILIAFKLLITMYKENNANNELMLTGFVVGCMSVMNTSFLMLFCWVTVCIMIMRPASVREWLLSTIGFSLPFYFIASCMYLLDTLNPSALFPSFSIEFKLANLDPFKWANAILILLLPWIGIMSYNRQIGKMMIQARKAYLIMLVLILVLLMVCLLSVKDISTILSLLLVPSALLFFPLFISFKRNIIPNLLLLALIILSLLG